MHRKANIFVKGVYCGYLLENERGYTFAYDASYLTNPAATAVSVTLPLQKEPYNSKTLFAFFDGLIPEGWLLDLAERNWKINYRDRMGLLLACCKDSIGAVSVLEHEEL
ncbi:HipA N-terminal domain-containing protein [Flavobacterium aurantiibacter]|uniref:Phosphatidylinositol kinase n=1 Tax=Flavobacterium aurantiibacter TaxID=2023067 RepID=A0A255ZQ84_9FLAO|nr:HipA N-terminal domain-containing protein [Flavobacterium aurantiibacter]OYQ43668.1 phosphatidylinositol kinase [Flavobacterium aurantiibacter]